MRDISSTNHGDCYCYGCFHSFRTQSKLKQHTNLCKDNKFCEVRVPEQGKNYKQHKYGAKSLRINDAIYLNIETLLKDYVTCLNNPSRSYTTNKSYYEPCGYSIATIRNHTKESIVDYHRGKDTLAKLCEDLREHARRLLDTEKLPMSPLTNQQKKDHDACNKCHIYNKKFITDKEHMIMIHNFS